MGETLKLRIALCQMDVWAGQPSRNFDVMSHAVDEARAAGADLVVFPEMCVGGYCLADRWTDEDFVDYLASFNDRVRALSQGIGIVFGNVVRAYRTPGHRGRDGRRTRYNAALFAQDGEWVPRAGGAAPAGVYVKALAPDYRMFDDDRYFTSALEDATYYARGGMRGEGEAAAAADGTSASGAALAAAVPADQPRAASGAAPASDDFTAAYLAPFAFAVRGQTVRVGLEVCEDLWAADYAVDPTACYAQAGCDLVVNVSASPWTRGKDTARDRRLAEQGAAAGALPPFVYVNAVGMQNTGKNVLAFDGASALYGPDGSARARLRDDFEPELAIVDVDDALASSEPVHASSYAAADDPASAKLTDALEKTIRRFDAQVLPWKPHWVIGLSGGIDSSVTCALAVRALGRDRVRGFNLATRHNSAATKSNADALAAALGVELRSGSIEPVVDATHAVVAEYGYGADACAGLVDENVQARMRGHLLSTFAQIEGGVIMNNGNKVEGLFGYATLYGDAIGALAPLGDVTKTALFGVARELNHRFGRTVVPEGLIPTETPDGLAWELPPTAELADGQRDPMKWFYHDWLVDQLTDYPGYGAVAVMERYYADRLASEPVGKWVRYYGLDDPRAFIDDLEWVLRQMRTAVFKRIQMPPNITVTRGSFGNDFRENQGAYEQTARYKELREAILALPSPAK